MSSLPSSQHSSYSLPKDLTEGVSALSQASLSAATQRAYRNHCRAFAQWCDQLKLPSFPTTPDILAGWVAHLVKSQKKPSTISQSVSAISAVHALKGVPNLRHTPEVKKALHGAARLLGSAPHRKEAATAPLVFRMIQTIEGDHLKAKRDRALLALGFAGAFRRSELVSLEIKDIQETAEGLLVTIRKSKTDQAGYGQVIGIPHGAFIQPLRLLREWIDAAEIHQGLIFQRLNRHHQLKGPLSGNAVAEIVKVYARRAGLDQTQFSGHSLRAGFITSGAEAGKDPIRIAEVSRHKNLDVLRTYVRRANLLKDHAGSSFL